jgi:hypothetical protein
MARNDFDINQLTRFATVISVIQEAPVLLRKDQRAARIQVIEAMRDDWAHVMAIHLITKSAMPKPKPTDEET